MAITFRDGSSLGLSFFIQVLQDGRPLGRIFHSADAYRFYPGDEPTLGAVALQSQDLERLKDTIRERYGGS
jgi:hypothetical protein